MSEENNNTSLLSEVFKLRDRVKKLEDDGWVHRDELRERIRVLAKHLGVDVSRQQGSSFVASNITAKTPRDESPCGGTPSPETCESG